MIKKFTTFSAFVLLSILFSGYSLAAIPVGYYSTLNGKSTQSLKTELFNIINPHTEVSYNSLWTHYKKTDVRTYPNDDQWWDMYSDETFYIRNGSRGMNREHSFPKSWWGGAQIAPYTDINHLYPSEADANMAKNNYPLGIVERVNFDNGVTKVGYPVSGLGGGASQVFEPADEYKGDFARTYFYMVTCYQNLTWKYVYMLQQNTYPTLKPWAYNMLLEWARIDPVSPKEIDRNNEVYKIQNNRNPFIDYPELAEYIWGNKMGQAFRINGDDPQGDPIIITPTQGTSLNFDETAVGSTHELQLHIKGKSLYGNVTMTLYSGDLNMFSIADRTTKSVTIPASYINGADGYKLRIVYKPTTLGNHASKIIVSDGGIEGSIGVNLIGESLPVPVLTQLTAEPAHNITESSYRASWNVPSETIDYYVVTRTTYSNGSHSTAEFVAEDNFLDFDDLNEYPQQSFTVQSVRLGYRSVASNVINVDVSGVSGVEQGKPLAIAPTESGFRVICGDSHSNAIIYDMQGRVFRQIPTLSHDDIITLPYGSYILRTDENIRPIKILIK